MFKFAFRKKSKNSLIPLRQRAAAILAAACKPAIEPLEERRFFSFSPIAMLPTGVSVTSIASADFNNDGYADIVTVGSSSGRGLAMVQLNHGDGTYSPATSASTGNNPVEVETGDFDGDGNCDIVTLASYYTGALTVLKGNGDGTFQPPTPYTVATPPTSIQVSDINGDGHPDLIAGNHYFNSVSVFKNNGLGALGPKVDFVAGGSPASVGIGDFNNDGKPDILTTNQSSIGSITLQMGNGDGTFGTPQNTAVAGAPFASTIADFNGDGNTDVALANSFGANTITLLLGHGDGTFASPNVMPIGTQPLDMQQGDFNHDGLVDLIQRTGSGFSIELNNGDGTFAAAVAAPTSPGNDLVVGDFNGDGFADAALGSSAGTVSIYQNDLSGITNPANVASLTLSAPASTPAGVPVPITVSAVDDAGNPLTDYVGTVNIFSTDPAGSTISYTFTAADAGVHTFDPGISLMSVGPQSIIATAQLAGSASTTVQVLAAPASRFAVAIPVEDVQAGTPVDFTVTALDSSNNMGATYLGTVHFTSSDVLAGLPADYTFTAADAGVHTFTATVRSAGLQTITVADTVSTAVRGTSNAIAVEAAEVSTIALTGGSGSIGKFRQVHIDSEDQFGNITGPGRTLHFTSSDPNAVLPADVTLVNGDASVLVKFMTEGPQTLTVTDIADPTMTGTETITATPADVGSFSINGLPATTAGVAQTYTVSAIDVLGHAMPNYTGTVTFSSSDFQAGLPLSYTFTAADAGVHKFTATLKTAGTQSIQVTDPAFAATGSQTGISVSAAAVATITSSGPQHVIAGTPFSMFITARDAFGNLASNYTGKVKFAGTDPQAVLPTTYTFTVADAGTHAFPIVFKTATAQNSFFSVTAVDASNSAVTTTLGGIEVMNGAAAVFTLAMPSNITAGTLFIAKLSVTDAYGNKVKDYTGTVHFSNTAGLLGLPADYTFNSADAGVHSFDMTLGTTTTQTITVSDLANSILVAKATVTPKAPSGGSGGGGGGGGGGSGKKIV